LDDIPGASYIIVSILVATTTTTTMIEQGFTRMTTDIHGYDEKKVGLSHVKATPKKSVSIRINPSFQRYG